MLEPVPFLVAGPPGGRTATLWNRFQDGAFYHPRRHVVKSGGDRLGRSAARCVNFVVVVTEDTGNQPRVPRGFKGRTPWLVEDNHGGFPSVVVTCV